MIHLTNILREIVKVNKPKGISVQDYRRQVVESILKDGYILIDDIQYPVTYRKGNLGGKILLFVCDKGHQSYKSPCLKCFPRKKHQYKTIEEKTIRRALLFPHHKDKQKALKTLLKRLNRRLKAY